MSRLRAFTLLLVAACLIAGLYGALHDQISYTVSPDYYHAFKFAQFQVPAHLHNRLGAALVGFLASWWMGAFIGIPILLAGLTLPDAHAYMTRCLAAFGVVAATTLVVGLGALAWASLAVTESTLPAFSFPPGVSDKTAFARAGTMHNFSYLGGFLGIVTGIAYLRFDPSRRNRRI